MTVPPEFYENIDRMRDLMKQQIEKYGELKRACRIADLLGVPPKELTGKVSSAIHDNGCPLYARPWNTREIVIRRDGEEVFRAKLKDIPQDLWPDDVRAEYERNQKRNDVRAEYERNQKRKRPTHVGHRKEEK